MVELDLSDTALAKLAAQAAADTPGVRRLAPTLGERLKGAALRAARQLTDAPPEDPRAADPSAVDLDSEDGGVEVAVRIVAALDPPVLITVAAVRDAVTAAMSGVGRPVASMTVTVVDVEV